MKKIVCGLRFNPLWKAGYVRCKRYSGLQVEAVRLIPARRTDAETGKN